MILRKLTRRGAALTVLGCALSGCADTPLAPEARVTPEASAPLTARGEGRPDAHGSWERGEAGSRTFVVAPGVPASVQLGVHTLEMPANSVCDPATSGYGPSYWDRPCRHITRPIEITATWSTLKGRPVVSFLPELRFVPASARDWSRWVILSLGDTRDIDLSSYYAILWQQDDGRWVDEARTDPSLVAWYTQRTRAVSRRLKHFSRFGLFDSRSGYNVTSGSRGVNWADGGGSY